MHIFLSFWDFLMHSKRSVIDPPAQNLVSITDRFLNVVDEWNLSKQRRDIDFAQLTGIPSTQLSKLRNGSIKGIAAETLEKTILKLKLKPDKVFWILTGTKFVSEDTEEKTWKEKYEREREEVIFLRDALKSKLFNGE